MLGVGMDDQHTNNEQEAKLYSAVYEMCKAAGDDGLEVHEIIGVLLQIIAVGIIAGSINIPESITDIEKTLRFNVDQRQQQVKGTKPKFDA